MSRERDKCPNIIVIIADDVGYSAPDCFGGETAIPVLDRIVGKGVRLTHFCNCGVCTASRASLLTGAPIACAGSRRS